MRNVVAFLMAILIAGAFSSACTSGDESTQSTTGDCAIQLSYMGEVYSEVGFTTTPLLKPALGAATVSACDDSGSNVGPYFPPDAAQAPVSHLPGIESAAAIAWFDRGETESARVFVAADASEREKKAVRDFLRL